MFFKKKPALHPLDSIHEQLENFCKGEGLSLYVLAQTCFRALEAKEGGAVSKSVKHPQAVPNWMGNISRLYPQHPQHDRIKELLTFASCSPHQVGFKEQKDQLRSKIASYESQHPGKAIAIAIRAPMPFAKPDPIIMSTNPLFNNHLVFAQGGGAADRFESKP